MTSSEPNEKSLAPSKWNPLNWLIGQEAEQLQIKQHSVFLDLPPEMRGMILDKLTGVDHKNCRLVCRQMKYDIEQDIGIRARICITTKTVTIFSLSLLTKVLFNYSEPSEDVRITRDKLQWLKTVRIISLDAEGLNHLPPTIGESIQRPLSLTKLVLRFDENIQCSVQALDIINRCNRLNSFQMTYEASKRFLKWHPHPPWHNIAGWRPIEAYNVFLSNVFQTVLQSLSRTHLKRLNIQSIAELDNMPTERFIRDPQPLEDYYIGMPSLNQALQIDVPVMLRVLEIHVIQFRNVHSPYSLSNQVHLWKVLLDAQTQLTHLSVRIGSIYWRFFEVVLNNCQRSLKSVEIDVCNWHDADLTPATDPHMNMHQISSSQLYIPNDNWFDWTVLFSQNCNLESLTIRMPPRAHFSANRTKNFCINFGKLKKLELHFVKLEARNVRQVLLELPELKELSLKEWHTKKFDYRNLESYKQQLEQTFNWIRNALGLQRLDSIKLFGSLVSVSEWEFRLRITNLNSNYIVHRLQLPVGTYYIPYRQYMANPTLHLFKTS